MKNRNAKIERTIKAALALGLAATLGCLQAGAASLCKKIVLTGETAVGQVWRKSLGQGWVFRIQPVQATEAGYSGWDLEVDRETPTGYPDALLLATLPFNSINEREIGTTYGLRAQDAVGWNPRTFHFLIDPAAFYQAQQLYLSLASSGQLSGAGSRGASSSPDMNRLLKLEKDTSSGEFRIEDSRLTPGIADAMPFAEAWALAAAHTPHRIVAAPDGKSSPRGSLAWMRFSITLWLPGSWRLPADLHGTPSTCVH
jgi:hypothetical protein